MAYRQMSLRSFCVLGSFLSINKKYHKLLNLQSRARNFPCKNPKKVGKLRRPWKIMSILLNYTNYGVTSENEKVLT